jgi:hypothetical protein
MKHLLSNWHIIPGILLGIYEVLTRVVPTSKSWSIVGKIIDILGGISDKLDNIKP